MRQGALAAGCGLAGAAVAYLLDPDRGRARRAQLTDRTGAWSRRARRRAGQQARYHRGQAGGAALRAAEAGRPAPVDDVGVRHEVRQQLSRVGFPTPDVTVDVVDGRATLRGQVHDGAQMQAVQEAVASAPGVRMVESWLHLPGEPAPNKAASLQASAR